MENNAILVAKQLARYYTVKQGKLIKKKAELKAMDGVSFTLEKGKTLAVVGESGCGKSTLARVVNMIEAPSSGDLYIGGIHVNSCTKEEQGDKQVIFEKPLHPYTVALMAATPHVYKARRMGRIRLSGELPSPLDALSICGAGTKQSNAAWNGLSCAALKIAR